MLELDFKDKQIVQDGINFISSDALSNEEYHKLYALSASGIKMAHKDPKLLAKKDLLMRLPSPALDMGTAVHEALLEPDKFDINKYSLTPANVTKLKVMINNGKVMFDYILKSTKNEVSLIIEDEGFTRKVRVDAYDEARGIVYDVKTTRYNSKSKFIRDAYDLDYHLQSAFYLDTLRLAGYKADYFAFLVIPSENPCEPFALQVSDRFVEDGRGIYSEIVENILSYDKTKEEVFFDVIDLPIWRLKQLGEDYE